MNDLSSITGRFFFQEHGGKSEQNSAVKGPDRNPRLSGASRKRVIELYLLPCIKTPKGLLKLGKSGNGREVFISIGAAKGELYPLNV